MGFAFLALVIAIAFTAVYGTMVSKLDDIAEADRCVAYDNYEYVDVYKKWKFVFEFGFGVWLAMIFVALIAMFAGFSVALACANCCINMCVGFPIVIQTIFMGIYRFTWDGAICSTEGSSFYDLGQQMQSVFIAQIVMWYCYAYCNNCAQGMNRKEWENRAKAYGAR
jgi:hypothetical protein